MRAGGVRCVNVGRWLRTECPPLVPRHGSHKPRRGTSPRPTLAVLALLLLTSPSFAAPAKSSDPGPWLIFDVAKSVYATENQGGNFVVEIRHGGEREIVYRTVWGAEAGVWLPQAVNLGRFAGQKVQVRLQTIAAYAFSAACFLVWGRPRIVTGALDAPTPPTLVTDLTENFRLGKDCRRYVFDAEKSGPLKTAEYDFTGGYFDCGQAGPWSEPALFGHPFCFGFHSWAGYEFDVTLPPRPTVEPVRANETPAPTRVDLGREIPILTWEQQVYRGAEGGQARFAPALMRLETRMPRHDQGLGYAFVGFETTGCDTLWIRPECDQYAPWAGYGEMDQNRFVGVVLDYHTPQGYARRVWLHYPPVRPEHPERRCERRAPTWHMDLARPRRVLEVNWEQQHDNLPPGQIVGLDLAKWAPPDWDGRMWFGTGIQDAGSQRTFAVTVLDRRPQR